MRRCACSWIFIGLGIVGASRAAPCLGAGDVVAPEDRAVAYLAREVPRWSAENRCFSCHNNGDGARALFMASGGSARVPGDALAETTRWLAKPEGWDRNGGDGPSGDKRLARVQFAAALAEAVAVGRVADRSSFLRAAGRLAEDQAEDGSWRLDEEESLGSPATYGLPLATFTALEVLRAADPDGTRFRDAIERADRWLSRREPGSTLDAAAGLLALGSRADPAAASRRRRLLDFLRAGRSDEGGWGPYRDSPSEPFDTAVVLLAFARKRDEPGSDALIGGGRAYLISTQLDDGSWPETTRPPGGESYAQRVSTTAWATRALRATRGGTSP